MYIISHLLGITQVQIFIFYKLHILFFHVIMEIVGDKQKCERSEK
jgi:hypothetical protein